MNYHAECYIKELQLKPANGAKVIFEPASGWMVERDSTKYLVLEEEAEKNGDKKEEKRKSDDEKMDDTSALLCKELSCGVKSPCDGCLLKNLLQVKLNKARVRINVTRGDDSIFILDEIHVI